MRYYIGFVLIVILTHNVVFAQKVISMTFRAGCQNGALRDELFSPLNYNKNGIKTNIGGEYRERGSLYFINLGYESSALTTPISADFRSIFHNATAQIGYLHQVWQPSSSVSLMCGGSYMFDMSGVIYQIYGYSYIATHSLEALVQVDWVIDQKHSISGRLSVNPVNFVARPPYNRIPNDFDEQPRSITYYIFRELKKTKFAPIGKHTDINLSLSYSYNLSKRTSLGMCYAFRVVNYSDYHKFSQFNNNLLLSFGIKL